MTETAMTPEEARWILEGLDTHAKRQEYENTHAASGGFGRLLRIAGVSYASAPKEEHPATGRVVPRTLTRSAFDALSPADRMKHVKAGGTVKSDPEDEQ